MPATDTAGIEVGTWCQKAVSGDSVSGSRRLAPGLVRQSNIRRRPAGFRNAARRDCARRRAAKAGITGSESRQARGGAGTGWTLSRKIVLVQPASQGGPYIVRIGHFGDAL